MDRKSREPTIDTYLEDEEDENSRVFVVRFGVKDLDQFADLIIDSSSSEGICSLEFCEEVEELNRKYPPPDDGDEPATEDIDEILDEISMTVVSGTTVTLDPQIVFANAVDSTLSFAAIAPSPSQAEYSVMSQVLTSNLYKACKPYLEKMEPGKQGEFVLALMRVKKEMGDACFLDRTAVSSAFSWSRSPQGSGYWSEWSERILEASKK